MSTIIIYYSYSGNTHKYATELAKKENADIYEIKDIKRPGKFKTFIIGCPKAMGHKTFQVETINIDFSKYDRYIICSPIWAGHPAPEINNVFEVLPKGSNLELHMISSSGNSSKDTMIEWLKGKGFNITKYIDTK